LDGATSVEYGNIFEILPTNALTPLGKYVTLTHYFDANLYHDMQNGKQLVRHKVNTIQLKD
jgi:hypothetical protein